jgi:hypothetical protein
MLASCGHDKKPGQSPTPASGATPANQQQATDQETTVRPMNRQRRRVALRPLFPNEPQTGTVSVGSRRRWADKRKPAEAGSQLLATGFSQSCASTYSFRTLSKRLTIKEADG